MQKNRRAFLWKMSVIRATTWDQKPNSQGLTRCKGTFCWEVSLIKIRPFISLSVSFCRSFHEEWVILEKKFSDRCTRKPSGTVGHTSYTPMRPAVGVRRCSLKLILIFSIQKKTNTKKHHYTFWQFTVFLELLGNPFVSKSICIKQDFP